MNKFNFLLILIFCVDFGARLCYNVKCPNFGKISHREVIMKNIPNITVDCVLELKKPHPCGSKLFKVNRVGSDIKLTCTLCKRSLLLDRIKVEKMIKNIITDGDTNG